MTSHSMELFVTSVYHLITTGKGDIPEAPEPLTFEPVTCGSEFLMWLSVSVGCAQAAVFEGRGGTLRQAVLSAVERFKRHQRLAPARRVDLRIDILACMDPLGPEGPYVDHRTGGVKPLNNKEGLGIGPALQLGFLAEELRGWNALVNGRINFAQLLAACQRHFGPCADPSFFDELIKQPKMALYRIKTRTYSVVNGVYTDHAPGKPIPVTEQVVLQAVRLTQEHYFKHLVRKNGRMVYSFLPRENRQEKKYNILRHAGTVYAMLETCELLPDPGLMTSIRSTLQYLADAAVPVTCQHQECRAIVEKDAIKLGGNGLAIVALAKYTQITGRNEYLPLMQDLARWIQLAQAESGRFAIHKQVFSTGEVTDFVSGYYPGEAMLAMARLYQLDGNERWLDVAEGSAHYLINIRDKGASLESIVHDHWLLYALNELYRERPHPQYLHHAMLIADAMVLHQIRDHAENPEYNGAYNLPHPRPESTPTACRSEGLCAAYQLVKALDLHEKAGVYRETIEAGLRFQLHTQLRPETTMFYRNPSFCMGAFTRSLTRDDLRIDFTQHNLSSLIGYYRILT
jgi:hypothetical protein